ncbi:Ig-like domain-containing protein [Hymenobacter psychrophilus]|uniref:Por secretion system C-terminal sorting domain-containing protein n=1 Tax=Hymenobacter psychrophilus TaxID=651662 RepID=A0A1H3LVQ3_9BACT|nr:Ig-like domain-containing protein [Hymenobacter psychrophilus]SDY68491.1 Por secretion system C-terminal sorting domain-containing protein [Hymenobacter psychrophilus]
MDAFLPNLPVACWRRLLASVTLLLLLLLPVLSRAQAPSVGQVLNPDGTLRPGAKGSFSTDGYRMGQNPDTGAPVFRPSGAGDENWQDGFDLLGMTGNAIALAVDGRGNVYAGGLFSRAGGTSANRVARWNGTSWSTLGTGMNSAVNSLAVDGSGNVYAGGFFTTAGGIPASRVAKWNGTSWSALGAGMNNAVLALAVDGSGNVYAGGTFTTAGGTLANRVARWNGTNWSALGTGLNNTAFALALDGNGNLYAGGQFSTAGGTTVNVVARWDGASWSNPGTGLGNGIVVRALAVDGSGSVYAGGLFSTASGTTANRVVRWNGTSWSTLGEDLNQNVSDLIVDGNGNVYVGGQFTMAGGTPANRIARWDGTSWNALGTGLDDGGVSALAVDGSGDVYAGGSFNTAGGTQVTNIAKWNGVSWSALGTGLSNSVSALAVDGSGNTYAGGTFITAGGRAASYIAKWDGTSWSALGEGLNGPVLALAVDGSGNVYAGGFFTQAGGASANYIAKWNGTNWSPMGTGMNTQVNALAVDGSSNVYAGGFFTTAGGMPANYIAKWNGASWSPLGTGTDREVYALVTNASGSVYVGGSFTTAGGTATNRVARWNGASWTSLGTGLNSFVRALTVDGSGSVYAGGGFTQAGGASANYIAKWNGTNWSALGTGLNTQVNALAVDGNSNIYAGGFFITAGGAPANRVAKWNGTSWSTLGTGLNNFVNALALKGNDLHVGGEFTNVGDGSKVMINFGIYRQTPPTVVVSSSTGASGSTSAAASFAYTVTFSAPVTGFAAGSVSVTNGTLSGFAGSGSTYTFNVTPAAAGAVTVSVAANVAQDQATNTNTASNVYTLIYSPGATVAPVLTAPVNSSFVNTATPTYAGTAPAASTVTVYVDGTAIGTTTAATNGSFSFVQPTALSQGSHTAYATALSGGATVSANSNTNTFIVDTVVPTVLISSSASSPTSVSPIPVTVTFSESVTGFVAADVVVSNGTLSGFSGLGATYTFNVTPAAAGAVTVNVAANVAQDQAGNGNTAAPQLSIQFAAPAAQDLTINGGTATTPTNIPAGTYNTVTVTGTGFAQLGGPVVVNGSLTVQNGGGLNTNCQPLTGSGSFTLAAGGTLLICDANGITASGITGAVQVTGARSLAADASYVYNGTAAQVTGTGLPAQVRKLSTTSNSPLTLSAPVGVRQVLTVAGAGNLNLNGQALTLRSDASGTAMVVNSGSGTVTGTATMQRYVDPSLNPGLGYRHYSSPVQATTVNDLATSGFAPVVNPAYNTAVDPGSVMPFPTVYGYDEARLTSASATTSAFEFGYFSPAALNNALVPGRGYTVNLAASQTVDLNGTLSTGTVPVGALSRGTQASAGWQLLGNPYPAPLDWNQARNGLPTGVIDAVYVYKSGSEYGGTYQFYQNGFGTLPGGLLPAMQGFFLRVSQNVPSFSFQNAWRVTGYQNPTFNRITADTRPTVQLDLVDARGTREPTYVYFEAGATPGRDDHYDAEKLPNTTGLNLASVATTGEALAINGLPALTNEAVTVPLTVDLPQAGRFALAAFILANLPATTLVELVDNQTGTRHDLRQLPAAGYGFTADSRHISGRFALNLRPNAVLASGSAALAAQVRVYPNPAHGQLTISRPAGGPASAVLLNAIGQQLRTVPLLTSETNISLEGLPTGVYALRVTLAGGQTVVQRVVVQ